MSDQVKEVIQSTVMEMIEESSSEENINKLTTRHINKVHFVPIRYRIIGGILQGMNIKFGNFIERLLRNIVSFDAYVHELPESGKKMNLVMTQKTEEMIDHYMSMREMPDSPDDCTEQFDRLLKKILETEREASEDDKTVKKRKDADVLYKATNNQTVFVEVKYNDDHDSGKFPNINRKFIKTWAGLINYFSAYTYLELIPILYYLNPRKRYGPIYVPSRNIMRGPQLFDKYFEINFEDVDGYLREIGEDPEVIEMFDEMYRRIRNEPIQGLDRLV